MNPYLVFGFCAAWILFGIFLLMSFLPHTVSSSNQTYGLLAVIACIFAAMLTIYCGTQWSQLHTYKVPSLSHLQTTVTTVFTNAHGDIVTQMICPPTLPIK